MPEMAAEAPATEPGKEPMPAMSFLDHLEELRRRIIYSIIAVAVGFFCCWGYAERIHDRPLHDFINSLRISQTTKETDRYCDDGINNSPPEFLQVIEEAHSRHGFFSRLGGRSFCSQFRHRGP